MKNKNLQPYFLGIIAAFGALAVEVAVSFLISPQEDLLSQSGNSLFLTILLSSFIEEIFKYLLILKNSEDILSRKKIIQDSLRIGAGFGITEFILKGAYQEDSIFFFASLAILVHLLTSLFIGITFPKNLRPTVFYSIGIILLVSLAHFAYNLLVLYL